MERKVRNIKGRTFCVIMFWHHVQMTERRGLYLCTDEQDKARNGMVGLEEPMLTPFLVDSEKFVWSLAGYKKRKY